MPEGPDSNCLFCRIVGGDIPSDPVVQDALTYAFRDINPAAPVHVLVVPRRHIAHFGTVEPGDAELLAAMTATTQAVAAQEGLDENGYRVVINVGRHGGMTVEHLHFHVIGGRPLRWPPE